MLSKYELRPNFLRQDANYLFKKPARDPRGNKIALGRQASVTSLFTRDPRGMWPW